MYHIILGNLTKYRYQGLDPESKVQYLLSGIVCDKLSREVATVRTHPDKYAMDFDADFTFLTQHIDKSAPTPNVNIASVDQARPAKRHRTSTIHGTFKGKNELKKYSKKEYDSMSMTQCQ